MYFPGSTVLITGGSRGIGLATAQRFLEHGAHVAICAQDPERLAQAEVHLRRFGDLHAAVVDVRDAQQVLDWVEQVRNRYGHLEVLGRYWSITPAGPGPGALPSSRPRA
jgi:3-oxoacyl-[acyl-carrier protein] reductase